MKRKKNRKETIYLEAARLFSEKGYAAASIRDIAQRVGIEPSSLYSHIKSKEELLEYICLSCAERYEDGMRDITSQELTNKEKLTQLIRLHINIAREYPISVTVFNDEWKHLPSEALATFLSKRKKYENAFKQILSDGMSNKEFHMYKLDSAFNIIINSIKWMHYRSLSDNKNKTSESEQEIIAFIERGFFLA